MQIAHVRIIAMGWRSCFYHSCCPSEGDWPRASRLLLHMEMRDGGLITACSFDVLRAAAFTRTNLSNSIMSGLNSRRVSEVVAESWVNFADKWKLFQHAFIVKALVHFSLSLWITDPITNPNPIPRLQRSEMRLLFSLFRVPLQYCQNSTEVIAPLAPLVTIIPNLATCWESGLLRNKSVLTVFCNLTLQSKFYVVRSVISINHLFT